MKLLMLTIAILFSAATLAQDLEPQDVSYEAAEDLDLDTNWLDPNELVKVLSYDATTHAYEISKVEDPTYVRIFATAESLAKALPELNLEMLKAKPTSVVGQTFELAHELVLVD